MACLAQDTMPILAYIGVPNYKTSDTQFRDFKDCGFDVSLYFYDSLDQLVTACRTAARQGVRIIGNCPEIYDQPEQAAKRLKNEPGFFGYMIKDEPSGPRIKDLQQDIARLKSVDNSHCFYINLYPYVADWILPITKTKTYEEYLRIASSTDCQQLSFDHYPVWKQGLSVEWFHNLEMVRNESLRTKKPFWAFVLSVPHIQYPQPTIEALRLQVYSNLAYGAQAIQYFTYWTPQPTKQYDFHNAPISRDGKKTDTYYLVQKMNRELRPIADLFYGAKVTNVRHIGSHPTGTKALRTTPTNINKLKVEGANGALVSEFIKGGHKYLAIVNKDYQRPIKLTIELKKGVVKVNKNLTTERPSTIYKIPAGDILLFRLK